MSTFKDPFAGTPKAATHRVYGVNNECPPRRGVGGGGGVGVEDGVGGGWGGGGAGGGAAKW